VVSNLLRVGLWFGSFWARKNRVQQVVLPPSYGKRKDGAGGGALGAGCSCIIKAEKQKAEKQKSKRR